MLNYSLKFGVAETARILNVDKNMIKTWAYTFSEYLQLKAHPKKGMPRQFIWDDILVFSYVLMYWEDDPDLECIKYGLNSNEHFEPPYIDILKIITPLFMEPPDDIDENCKDGIVFSGMAEYGDTFTLAQSYKLAGDKLVEAALKNDEKLELFCPVIYNYRHATELYLKAIVGITKRGSNSHNLLPLLQKFKVLVKTEFNSILPQWFENIVIAFNDFDPNGTTFRYGGSLQIDEVFFDLNHAKTLMGWLSDSFQKIMIQKGIPY